MHFKTFITSIGMACSVVCATAQQQQFTINGMLEGLSSDSVYLLDPLTNVKEAAPVKNGKFFFKGTITFPDLYELYLDAEENNVVRIFLENSAITITGKMKELGKVEIKGSRSNDEFGEWRAFTKNERERFNSLDALLYNAADALEYDKADSLQILTKEAGRQWFEKTYEWVKLHRQSYIIPFIVHRNALFAPEKEFAKKTLGLSAITTKGHPRVGEIEAMFAAIERTAVGKEAPLFEMKDRNGTRLNLASYKGKVVLLDFWASWCRPCIKAMPSLVQLYQKYKGQPFEIVGFSIDKEKGAWEKMLDKLQLPWTQVVELRGAKEGAPKQYGILFIPTSFLIDKKGKIAGTNLYGKKLENKIAELLKEN